MTTRAGDHGCQRGFQIGIESSDLRISANEGRVSRGGGSEGDDGAGGGVEAVGLNVSSGTDGSGGGSPGSLRFMTPVSAHASGLASVDHLDVQRPSRGGHPTTGSSTLDGLALDRCTRSVDARERAK